MERLLIILAVLVCVAAGIAVVAMSARGRRPPLRMHADLDADDERLFLGSVGTPESPIDRSAQVLDTQVRVPVEAATKAETPRQVEGRRPDRPEGAR